MIDYRVQRWLSDLGQQTGDWFTVLTGRDGAKAAALYIRCLSDGQRVRLQKETADGWSTVMEGQLTRRDVVAAIRGSALQGEFGNEAQSLLIQRLRTPRWRFIRRRMLALRAIRAMWR